MSRGTGSGRGEGVPSQTERDRLSSRMRLTRLERALDWATGSGGPPVFEALRSDDLLALIGDLFARPAELGLGGGGEVALGAGAIALATVVSVLLAVSTYALGGAVGCFEIASLPRKA